MKRALEDSSPQACNRRRITSSQDFDDNSVTAGEHFPFTFRTLAGTQTIDVLPFESVRRALARHFNVPLRNIAINVLDGHSEPCVVIQRAEIHHDPYSENYRCPPGFLELFRQRLVADDHYSTTWMWGNLSKNPGAVEILEENLDKVDWSSLSMNPGATHLLAQNIDKINWSFLSSNRAAGAIQLLSANIDQIDWEQLSRNPSAIEILKANIGMVNWRTLSENPNAVELLAANPRLINWKALCRNENPEALRLLVLKPHQADWGRLSQNPGAIELLTANQDQIAWNLLSTNPNAIDLLAHNLDKVDWRHLSGNPNATELLLANPRKIRWPEFTSNPKAIDAIIRRFQSRLPFTRKMSHSLCLNPHPNAIQLLSDNPDNKIDINWFRLARNPGAAALLMAANPGTIRELNFCDPIPWTEI